MAKEKFIRGKKDDCHHGGLYHNKRVDEQYTTHLREEMEFINSLTPAQQRAYLYSGWLPEEDYERSG